MKYLTLFFLLFSQGIFAQVNVASSFKADSVTMLVLRDSTTLIGYVINENDTAMVFSVYYYGPEMVDKSKILSRENKLKSSTDLSASSVIPERGNSKPHSLLSALIVGASNPVGLIAATQLPASKHIPAKKLLVRAHRIWITGVNDSAVVVPRKSFLYSTTATDVVIKDAMDTSGTLINVPVRAINTISVRKYHSMAESFVFWSDLGSAGVIGFFIFVPVMSAISVCESLKKQYHIAGNPESYDKIKDSLNRRAIAK